MFGRKKEEKKEEFDCWSHIKHETFKSLERGVRDCKYKRGEAGYWFSSDLYPDSIVKDAAEMLQHYVRLLTELDAQKDVERKALISAREQLSLLEKQFDRATRLKDTSEAKRVYAEINKIIDSLSGKCEVCGK
jgi:hypothetical protein